MQVQALTPSLVQPQTVDPSLAQSLQTRQAGTVTTQAVQAASNAEPVDERSKQSLEESVAKINQTIASFGRSVQFSIDGDTRIKMVKVVDTESKEVIRQIPSEELIDIARAIDKLQGLLLRDKA